MNTGLEELERALYDLSNYVTEYASDNGCQMAAINADSISETFSNVNNSLSAGWESVGDFFGEIADDVAKDVIGIHGLIYEYLESSKETQDEELKVVANHEESTQSILDEMGIE